MSKVSLPKGTRDFSPEILRKRRKILDVIRHYFELYGFQPIETPAFEKLSTLTGKYGDEGDRLIFKILNSGNYASKVPGEIWQSRDVKKITPYISERALRYDLTVPFARYVVQHRNELVFPFKRYQIQPVWRADRPQKGRFREFYQCDADVVGSRSLWQDAEFVRLYADVFNELRIPAEIHINNRKILAGFAEVFGLENRLTEFTVILDKLDKIGKEGVEAEFKKAGFSDLELQRMEGLWQQGLSNAGKLAFLKEKLKESETGMQGVAELETVLNRLNAEDLRPAVLTVDWTLARGLDYYTGSIFEVRARDVSVGSIGGGGRYDDLTGIFGLKDVSGIGISFGLDRIYLVMEELGLFDDVKPSAPQVLLVNFGEAEATKAFDTLQKLRQAGISAEMYPDKAKMKKQMQYADKRRIPYVIIIGEDELEKDYFTLKNMTEGSQEKIKFDELIRKLKQ